MKLETQTFKHILEVLNTEDNWDIYKNAENFVRHSNLVNLLNAVVLVEVKRSAGFGSILKKIFGLFFQYHTASLNDLMPIVKRKMEDYYNENEHDKDSE